MIVGNFLLLMGNLEGMVVEALYHVDIQAFQRNNVGWKLLRFIFINKQAVISQYIIPGLHDSSHGPYF
jgi:hypothetical protein